MAFSFKLGLLAATAGVAMMAGTAASAQSAPTPPSGGFYMANGARTTNYQTALASWRSDAQFSVDYSKGFLGLEHAYAMGLTGRGQTIGVNDAGVYVDHPLFGSAGKVTGLHTQVVDGYGNDGLINPRRRWEGHGTHVSGTIAGDRIAGQPMFGNAFNAKLYAATTNFAAGDFLWFKDAIIDGKIVATSNQNIVDLANTGQVRIINNSWGSGNSLPFNASLPTVLASFNRNYGDYYKPVLDKDVLVVFSAGNGYGVHAGIDAAAPLNDPRLRSNWLSVANYSSFTAADPSTSFCGQTATWCVAGPGSQVISSVPDYEMDWRGILSLYSRTEYRGLFTATSVSGLQSAAVNKFLVVLNDYLDAQAAGGASFDEEAARREIGRQAAAITLIAGARLGDPDGLTSLLGRLLTDPDNMAILTPAFSSDVLQYANDELQRVLNQYIQYTGAGYAAYTGTSMAAPNISGFAALLMENFPEYSTALISDILVSSSKDLDTPGVDLRSGWGAPQMDVALRGPTALRDTRDVTVAVGTVDIWSNNIGDARDRYSAEVLANFGNDIGGLVKKGGGQLILTGANDYSGPTRVEGGLLTVNGSLLRSSATVGGVGMIGGTGRLLNLTAESGGVVSPGDGVNPFGTLTVAGNLNFKPGSFLWIRSSVNGAAYSRLNVGGATQIDGGQVILKADNGEWNLRTQMNIINSTGAVTGKFSGAQSDLAFLSPVLTYSTNGVMLTVRRNDVTVASLGLTDNQKSVGGALDVMINNTATGTNRDLSLENALLDASVPAVQGALSGLTGEVHASLGGLAVSDTRAIRDAMSERGRSRDGASTYVGNGVSVWGSGVYGNGRGSAHDGIAGFRSEGSGYLVGAEKALSNDMHIGVALGETRSELRSSRLRSTGRVNSEQIGVYGGVGMGDFQIRVGGSWANTDVRTDRTAQLNAFNNALVGNYDGNVWQAYGEVAWSRAVGGTTFEPYGAYSHVQYDADVAETGGDAALSGKVKQKADLLTAGFRTRTVLAGGAGRPRLSAVTQLAYTHDLNGDGPVFDAAFADGPRFLVDGANPGDGVVTGGLAFNIQATERTAVEMGYSGVYKDEYRDNRIYGRFSVKF
ncbi:Extracellular serine protease precursor [Brevundimonas sp. SH203]|uniref:S8 family serine peptidase n=1 Tax=Brevundimonas sp. SH203 TaxID=345167 RepID=UPI0009C5BAB5|nr:S8 family serine peptidase [Brevundimonas sp. SH203]GAW41062.1 Extracellular serine protease precursor [Brevundimonas sp. SH203]